MTLIRWNPFLMDDALEDFFKVKMSALAVDVYEKDGDVIVEAPLQGIDPKKIKIDIGGGILTIKGEEEKKSEVEEKNYYRKEVSSGSFHRTVRLPVAVKEDEAEAKFKDGILKISIPKAEQKKPKKSVDIKIEKK